MAEAFLIPIDLHKELFEDLDSESKERADTLLVNIDTENKEIIFTVVEIKCRKNLSGTEAEELQEKMQRQIENTILALKTHFEVGSATEGRLDRELKTLELSNLLTFYASRAGTVIMSLTQKSPMNTVGSSPTLAMTITYVSRNSD